MFWTRLFSGAVLLIVMIGGMILGGDIFYLLTAILAFIGLYEIYKTYNIHNTMLGYLGMVAAVIYIAAVRIDISQLIMAALVLGFFILMFAYVFTFPKFKAEQVAFSVFGFVYVPVMMMCMYQVRQLEDGVWLFPLILISAWGNDTFAYCVGCLFGKHKMAPQLSPKKSVEGAIGGIAGAVLLGALYGFFVADQMTALEAPTLLCAIVCGVGALLAIVGDLAASAIKRNLGIKDYGKLIPGHGGVMDRFDSILFTAPVVYFIVVLVG